MNTPKDTIDKLWAVLINFDWFADKIEVNQQLNKSLIAYVDSMNKEILSSIPDQIDDFDVRVHYIASIDDKHAAKLPSNKLSNSLEKIPEFTTLEVFDA